MLIGFESLDENVLRAMRKTFNTMRGGFAAALANLRRHGIRVYGTFVFGYDGERADASTQAAEFAIDHRFYLAAFNHLTPFPGTPLFARLQREGRLLYERWWLDERYGYNGIPFQPAAMAPDDIRTGCLRARRKFYSWASMARRAIDPVNRADAFMFRNFFVINGMHRVEVAKRDHFPARRPDLERTVAQGGVSGRDVRIRRSRLSPWRDAATTPTSGGCCARTRPTAGSASRWRASRTRSRPQP